MPGKMRSAAKDATEAIKGTQEPIPDDDKTEVAAATEENIKPPKTPSKPIKATTASATKSTGRKRKAKAEMNWPWTEQRPTREEVAEHQRTTGRNLIPWQRVRMAEKMLLMIEYECNRQNIPIPWDDIAHRFHPGATAAGVQQHFARLRTVLAPEGHLVPPKLHTKKDRKRTVDSTIRCYVRQSVNEDGAIIVRPVKFSEPIEHATHSRADAHDLGAYDDQEDDDVDAMSRKSRKLAEGAQPGSASKKKHTRRTRTPMIYLDRADSDEYDADMVDYPEEAGSDDDEEDAIHMDENDDEDVMPDLPVRGDASIEQLAINLYTRNLNPRVISKDPRPKYEVGGQTLTFQEVCSLAVQRYQRTGYQDPECGIIIANHMRTNPPVLGHFQVNNFSHPIARYPHLYHPVGVDYPSTVHHQGSGFNNGHAYYQQPFPSTPTKGQAYRGDKFSPHDSVSGMGSARKIKQDFSSPGAFNPGGKMADPNAYKTPEKPKPSPGHDDFGTPTPTKHYDNAMVAMPNKHYFAGNNDLPVHPFHDFQFHDLRLGSSPAGPSAHRPFEQISNVPAAPAGDSFDEANYRRYQEAQNYWNNPQVPSEAGNVGPEMVDPSAPVSGNEFGSPHDTTMAGPSSVEPSPSPTTAPVSRSSDED